MASLLGQYIEPNYKGILNFETINQGVSASLQRLTDGSGNNTPISVSNNLTGIASAVQYDWVSTPTGAANKTTMWFDATGKMSWRPGTGASSFVRNFDATGITADRSWSLPDATTTLAGLSVAQTFSAAQTFSSNIFLSATDGTGFLQSGWQTVSPSGVANRTTLWFDSTGRINWRPGTGASSFIRAFDATGITANRSWTLPDATTTLAGLAVAQTFTQAQNINANLYVGNTGAASARLHVRGDGTNPVVRFEASSGFNAFTVSAPGTRLLFGENNSGVYLLNSSGSESLAATNLSFRSAQGSASYGFQFSANSSQNWASGTGGTVSISDTFASSNASGTALFRPLNISYTINNSAAQTGTATGIFLNATETALNGMAHNLMDLQIGGVSRFKVKNNGYVSIYIVDSIQELQFVGGTRIQTSGNGSLTFTNSNATAWSRLNFGGTTSAFPALQVNGTTLEVRLADGGALTGLSAGVISGSAVTSGSVWSVTYRGSSGDIWATLSGTGASTKVTSAALWNMTGLPTTRPATVGDLYVDTAANILANGDKVVGIRV